MNNPRFRNYFVYILIGIAVLAIILGVRNNGPATTELKISELAQQIKDGKPISAISVVGQSEVRVTYSANQPTAVTRKDPAADPGRSIKESGRST